MVYDWRSNCKHNNRVLFMKRIKFFAVYLFRLMACFVVSISPCILFNERTAMGIYLFGAPSVAIIWILWIAAGESVKSDSDA